MPGAAKDNDGVYSNNITFCIRDTKLYVLSSHSIKKKLPKISKLLRKKSRRSMYWNERKRERGSTSNSTLKSTSDKKYDLPKSIISNYHHQWIKFPWPTH